MSDLKQTIRYCRAPDGRSIAWTRMGSGPPLVWSSWANYFSHELFEQIWRPWLAEMMRSHSVIFYDGRGTGLSDRHFEDVTLESLVCDIESVVAAAGLEHFALCSTVHGALAAIVYAARHPDQVSRLMVYGGFSRGMGHADPTPAQRARYEAMIAAFEAGWDDPNPAFRFLNSKGLYPDATRDELEAITEFSRVSFGAKQVASLFRAMRDADVTQEATQVRCPTLILHSRGDLRSSFEGGKRLAGLIPGAQFAPIDSRNSDPMPSDPAWPQVRRLILEFLAGDLATGSPPVGFADLTLRERDVLELLAQGLDNHQIAAHLDLAEKSIRNRVTVLFDKLDVENRSQAIVKAREAGFGAPKRPG